MPFLFALLLLAVTASASMAAPAKPTATTTPSKKPVTPPPDAPIPAPAFLDVVTFQYRIDSENHKVVVTMGPNLLRVDEPADRYSFFYNPKADFYTGLEHSNYTYWTFSWPEVRGAVETSKRGEKRLQDLGNDGLTSDDPPAPTTNTTTTAAAPTPDGSDASGYVWKPTTDKKEIADLPCVRWTGETISGENCEAWCSTGVQPQVSAAIDRLRTVNGPMALVPVRTVVPDFIFVVYNALLKAGVTPLEINWGGTDDKGSFRLLKVETRDGKLSLFAVPKTYMKTTLVTMDGMTEEQPAPEVRGSRTPPPVDHSQPQPTLPGQ